MAPSISRTVGSYNWANPSEKQAQLIVRFEVDGKTYGISDTVEPDSRDDFDPSDIDIVDAVDHIERTIKRYWISTSRDETLAKIAVFRAHQSAIRKEWLLIEATRCQRKAAIEHKRFRNIMAEIGRAHV